MGKHAKTTAIIEAARAAPAEEISRLHGEVCSSLTTTFEKAVRIGQLLTEQKKALGHGAFGEWIIKNLPFTDRSARNYMRVYRHQGELKSASVSELTDGYEKLRARQRAEVKIAKRKARVQESLERIEYAKQHPGEVLIGQKRQYRDGVGNWLFEETITGEMNGLPFKKRESLDPGYLRLEQGALKGNAGYYLRVWLDEMFRFLDRAEKGLHDSLKKYAQELEMGYWLDFDRGIRASSPEFKEALTELEVFLKSWHRKHRKAIKKFQEFQLPQEGEKGGPAWPTIPNQS